jgi:hypothetical protein
MSAPGWTGGLQLDQAPPLAVPTAFFVTAPLAVFAAGVLLLVQGASALSSNWAPQTIALTHLGTLGFLAMTMFGALYQLAPVVAGAPVPRIGLSRAVHALLLVGLIGLESALLATLPGVMMASLMLLTLAVIAFIWPLAIALKRAPTRSATVSGMRLAVSSLLVVALLGVWMAHGHAGLDFPGARALWVQVHLGIGFLGWVGGLISAVSWQVLPMFYGATPHSEHSKRVTLVAVAVGVTLPALVLALEFVGLLPATWPAPSRLGAIAALPAAVAVWCLQPWWSLRAIAKRRRRRRLDGSLLYWRAGLAFAALAALLAIPAHLSSDPRPSLALGWVVIWGWAGMIVHGMLSRIVPFLVWFHRFSPALGRVPVPSLRTLLPDPWMRLGFALHLGSVLIGLAAIATGADWLARLTGLALAATALQLLLALVHVLRQRVPESGVAAGR